MKIHRFTVFVCIALALLLGIGVDSFAQGKSGGRPAGNPGGGRPTNIGVDRGIGTASQRSNGRSDSGSDIASDRSNGRSDTGIERARLMRDNSDRADREIRENPRLPEITKLNANDLRSGYQAALATNPNLKFGQFVAANMIPRNLGERNPNITTAAILAGLAQGDSIGEVLKAYGVSKDEAKRVQREVKQKIKDAKD